TSPYRERIQWEKLHFFWGDERAVPFEDSRNNARMTFEALLNKVPVKKEQIHIMQTDIAPDASAFAYEKILHTYFPAGNQTFDLVLNGMGDDAHTLSLFPGSPAIKEQEAWVTSFWLQAQDMHRITLTAPVVNLAKKVVFLTFGANKANALKHVIEGPANVELYPSQLIQPQSGELHWFVDEAAASELENK
ncbi:MAG: 6-phosphogluconolactonase, partial [Chitinophagaceae bacterium]|nr:6-phosphogluconolactonase [Chitinophagaceae bacterium]